MKHLILTCITIILLPCCVFCQSNSSQPDSVVYGSVQNNFPGGQEGYNNYLGKGGSYPEPAKSVHVEGVVYIRLVIEKDGTISNVHLCDGAGSGMDDAGLKLIANSGKWIPNQINGANVRTHCIVTVRFSLGHEKPISNSGIYGDIPDDRHFKLINKVESLGIPVTEASSYVNRDMAFMGEIYGTKALSDTVFIMTCGNVNPMGGGSVNVVLYGKGAFTKNINKQDLNNKLIVGIGSVIASDDGTPVILIKDDKKCRIIKQSAKRSFGNFLTIYDFANW